MGYNKFQGSQNNIDGEKYQIWVRDYLETIYNALGEGICTSGRGVDVTFRELRVEVKGINYFTEVTKSGTRFKAFRMKESYLQPDLTHFCFVLNEPRLCEIPLLYFVNIEVISDYFYNKRSIRNKCDWLRIPFHWILDNFNRELSRIGV